MCKLGCKAKLGNETVNMHRWQEMWRYQNNQITVYLIWLQCVTIYRQRCRVQTLPILEVQHLLTEIASCHVSAQSLSESRACYSLSASCHIRAYLQLLRIFWRYLQTTSYLHQTVLDRQSQVVDKDKEQYRLHSTALNYSTNHHSYSW